MIVVPISGSLIAGIQTDEVVVSYLPDGVTTVFQYLYKGNLQATLTETVDTNNPARLIHAKRT
jgi:hypothetical protein